MKAAKCLDITGLKFGQNNVFGSKLEIEFNQCNPFTYNGGNGGCKSEEEFIKLFRPEGNKVLMFDFFGVESFLDNLNYVKPI